MTASEVKNPKDIFRRPGLFRVDLELLSKHPEAIQALLSKILVVTSTVHFGRRNDLVEYRGYSWLFSELASPEATTPTYSLRITKGVDGQYQVKLVSGEYDPAAGTVGIVKEKDW